jgi:long-chain acyl-CoA synthetase
MTIGAHNLAGLAEAAFERHGDRDSVWFEGSWHRSGALHERSTRLAAGFRDLGVAPGDRVVVMMASTPEVGVCYTALWRAGAVITPAIFLLPPPEVRHLLADSGAVGIVTTPELLPTVRQAAEGVPTLRWIACADAGGEEGVIDLEALAGHDPTGIVPRADDDLAALLYTGGTTGRSKGVMLSHENLWACARASHEAAYVPGVTRTIVPLPLAHAFGLAVTVTGMHAEEPGTSVLLRWFDPDALLALIAEHRVQRATLVPMMIQLLLTKPLEEHDLSSLRYVTVGAAPLAPETIAELERRVPGITVLEGYGCTESGGVISVNRPGQRRVGTVGIPLPGYEVRLAPLDVEGGSTEPEHGEIAVRSRGVMQGYWNAPEATAHALRDGWLHTGDVGAVDDDGFLTIVDRVKDVIIRGGFNVYPSDVEDALLEHPAVAVAGVVGRPDERHGEEVVAYVQLLPGQEVSSEDLVAFGKERLGGYKYPREVHVLDALPHTPVGKLDRKALRGLR